MPASAPLARAATSLESDSELGQDLPVQIAEPDPFDDYEADELVAADFFS